MNQLVVIQNQDESIGEFGNLIDQSGNDDVYRRRLHRLYQTQRAGAGVRKGGPNGPDKIVEEYDIDPKWAARYLFEATKAWGRKGAPVEKLDEDLWLSVFKFIKDKDTLVEKGLFLIDKFLNDADYDLEKELNSMMTDNFNFTDVEEYILQLLKEDFPEFSDGLKKNKYMMGLVMKRFRGHLKGAEVERITEKVLRNSV